MINTTYACGLAEIAPLINERGAAVLTEIGAKKLARICVLNNMQERMVSAKPRLNRN